MKLSRVHPAPAETLDLDDDGARDRLLEWYRPLQPDWLRTNLVLSANGSAAGPDGTSESLSGGADRRILGVIRELSDIVLVGAASVRTEGYQVPKRSRLAVLTASGDLTGHRLAPELAARVTVVGPAAALQRARSELPGAELLELAEASDAAHAIGALRAAGYRSIVCEGGPSLAGQLVAAGLVDELCFTTAPVLTAMRAPALVGDLDTARLDLRQLAADDEGHVFTRWVTRVD